MLWYHTTILSYSGIPLIVASKNILEALFEQANVGHSETVLTHKSDSLQKQTGID